VEVSAKIFRTVMLPVGALAPPATNPNSMPDADYAALVANIRGTGFLQPVLVRGPEPPRAPTYEDDARTVEDLFGAEGAWRAALALGGARGVVDATGVKLPIVDGEHRWRAAVEVGLAEVPCVVGDFDERTARLLQIGMNRLRGELNLGAVGRVLEELSAAGAELDELLLSGYAPDEVEGLLAAMRPDPVDLGDVGSVGGEDPGVASDGGDGSGKAWVLEVVFETRKELQAVKKKLNRLGNKDFRRGLLKALDEE
jgi:ParB-like chromosome segregation protein Spo0J